MKPRTGSLHVLRQTLDDVAAFFRSRGFAIVLGPEVETDFYAFEAMNIPADHPAREGMDTFYIRPGTLLRPHTSPVQMRAMQAYPPPLAILVPGKAYRRDALDASHSFMFHQIEGLHVDRGVNFGHLKGFASDLCRHLMGETHPHALPPVVLPVHRAVGRDRSLVLGVRRRGLPHVPRIGLARDGRLRHGASQRAACSRATIRSCTAAGRGAWGSSASRSCVTASTTSACFTENDPDFLEQFA